MKKHSEHPLTNLTADEPIIRPLEQRRVPSATGAVFALPVLPEAPEDAPVEEIPADFEETAIDAELVDPIFTIESLPAKDGEFEGELSVTFDDVIEAVEGGEPLVEDGTVEEFNPDVIFYTLFQDEGATEGEVIELEGEEVVEGEGEILIDDIIEEVPVDKDGDGVEDSPDEGEPVEITPDMVKRGGDGASTDGEYTPEMVYTMTGGNPQTAAPETPEAAETAHDTAGDDAPAPLHAAPVAHSAMTEAAVTQPDSAAIAFHTETSAPDVVVAHASTVIPFAEVNVSAEPSAGDFAAHLDVASLDLHAAPLVLSHAGADLPPAGFETAHGDLAVDEWVPAQGEVAAADLVTHFDSFTADELADHAALIAPIDAGAAAAGHAAPLHGSSLAMAATGAMLLTRDGKARKEKEQA